MPLHLKVAFCFGCGLVGMAACGLFFKQPEIGALLGGIVGAVLLFTAPEDQR